jgi:hypothetical protein
MDQKSVMGIEKGGVNSGFAITRLDMSYSLVIPTLYGNVGYLGFQDSSHGTSKRREQYSGAGPTSTTLSFHLGAF